MYRFREFVEIQFKRRVFWDTPPVSNIDGIPSTDAVRFFFVE
jgi:hypothetical protein